MWITLKERQGIELDINSWDYFNSWARINNILYNYHCINDQIGKFDYNSIYWQKWQKHNYWQKRLLRIEQTWQKHNGHIGFYLICG